MTVKDFIYFYENLSISDICGSPGHAFGSCLYLHLAVYILNSHATPFIEI